MSLLHGALRLGRFTARSRYTETVIVGAFRDGTDPVTGEPTRVLVEKFYEDIGQIKFGAATVSDSVSASQPVGTQSPILKVPVLAFIFPRLAEVKVAASSSDPGLVGRMWTIDGAPESGQVTAHRYPLKELT